MNEELNEDGTLIGFYPVIERGEYCGKRWAVAEYQGGLFLRYFQGQENKVFMELQEAMEDCGILGQPEDKEFPDGY